MKLDFNDVYEGTGKVADGTYEVLVNKCEEGSTPSGAEYIEFDLIIRNDVDQAYKNSHIFHKTWKAKADNKYNMKSFNTIGKACQLPNGKSYKTLDELLADYVGKTAVVNVANEESEHNGKTYNNTNVKYWVASKLNGHNHVRQAPKANESTNNPVVDNTSPNVSDDDLPF
jgi:hypothetical protein